MLKTQHLINSRMDVLLGVVTSHISNGETLSILVSELLHFTNERVGSNSVKITERSTKERREAQSKDSPDVTISRRFQDVFLKTEDSLVHKTEQHSLLHFLNCCPRRRNLVLRKDGCHCSSCCKKKQKTPVLRFILPAGLTSLPFFLPCTLSIIDCTNDLVESRQYKTPEMSLVSYFFG